MASQVQLTNTFNEFRQAYNDAANDVTQLESSNTTVFSNIAGANAEIATIKGLPVPATQTFVVTVVANPGSPPPNDIYRIDGVNNPVLNLVRGGVYTFDLSDASNAGHPLAFRTSADAAFTTGVVSTGTAGQAGAQVVFTVPDDAPNDLKYYCVTHGNGMGNTIAVTGAGRGGILFVTNAAISSAQTNIGTLQGLLNGAANLVANNIQSTQLTGGRIVILKEPNSGSGAVLSDDDGLIYHSGNNSVDLAGNLIVGANAEITGNVEITGTLDVFENTSIDGTLDVTEDFTINTDKFTVDASTGDIVASGNLELTFAESRIDAFDIRAENQLVAGVDLEGWATGVDEDLSIHRVISVEDVDGPSDHLAVNRNDGVDAYAEFIAINDVGNTEQGWISMGINSSNYGAAQYAVTKNDDGYILYQPPEGTSANGDLVIGTGGNGTKNRILFSAEGFDDPANNTQMTITPGESVLIQIDTESANSSTGALIVQGGIGLQGNLNVGGNVAISGTITLGGGGNTVSTSSLTVDSPIIFLGQNNAADTFDLGFVGEFNDGVKKYSGFVRDASDGGTYKLFSNTDILPANTVDFTDVNLVYSGVQVGSARIVDATVSSSNTTGALIVTGGVGISGAVNASGLVRATDTTASTSTSSGAVVVSGGVGVAGNTHIGGLTRVADTTTSTSTSTGALVVSGGVGVAGNTHIGGDLVVTGDATFTGLLRVQELVEDIVDVTASGNAVTLNYNDANIFFEAGTYSANFTINITNVPTTNGRTTVVSYILTQGATGRIPTTLNVNGSAVTIKYVGGTNPTPTSSAGKIDVFSFTLIRRGDAFTALAQATLNF